MYNNEKRNQKLKIVIFVLITIQKEIFCFGNLTEEKRINLLHRKECAALCENLNLTSKKYLIHINNVINIGEQRSKKCALLLNESIYIHPIHNICKISECFHANKDLKNNFIDYLKSKKSIKLFVISTTNAASSTAHRNSENLIHSIDRLPRRDENSTLKTSHEKKQIKTFKRRLIHCTEGKQPLSFNTTFWTRITQAAAVFSKFKKFNITNDDSGNIRLSLNKSIRTGNIFLWYASYENRKMPKFECRKVQQQNFTLNVSPNVNYLICFVTIKKYFRVNIFDCQPYKTNPLFENQPLMVKKSIPTLIISVFVLFVLAMSLGATVLYLVVHKNPSLIRGNKRVIKVKRQDKTKILIMPRGYENLSQTDRPLELSKPNTELEPAISTLSCDTNSTISYVSANQPTPVEILTYRLHRLRELFQSNKNNISSLVTSIPMSSSMSLNQRLPPNVDLLLEYEWYTITTTVITTTEE